MARLKGQVDIEKGLEEKVQELEKRLEKYQATDASTHTKPPLETTSTCIQIAEKNEELEKRKKQIDGQEEQLPRRALDLKTKEMVTY